MEYLYTLKCKCGEKKGSMDIDNFTGRICPQCGEKEVVTDVKSYTV